eukprot:gene163-278_t
MRQRSDNADAATVRLSNISRILTVPYFAVNAIIDPTRGDMVAGLGDVTGHRSLQMIYNRMKKNKDGCNILQNKPVINSSSVDLPFLRNLPDGIFGKEYIKYMDSHGFVTDERPSVIFVEDPELSYVMLRYRQIHDFWHVLCGLPPTVLGEIALKWFEWRITGLPVCGMSSVFGPLRLTSDERKKLMTVYIPWALHSASNCHDLMSFKYEDNLNLSVEDIRVALNVTPAPKYHTML